jgi:hypothetical protein
MTSWIATLAIGAIGTILLGLGTLLWVRLSGYRRPSGHGSAAASEPLLASYDPMARLLRDEDLDFLRQFTNCRPKLATQWERDRKHIFRLYLRLAAADFQRLHADLRLRVANAPEDQAALVGVLMRQQVTFWRTLTLIELRLALSGLPFGMMSLRTVDARKIVALIEAIKAEAQRSLAPTPA